MGQVQLWAGGFGSYARIWEVYRTIVEQFGASRASCVEIKRGVFSAPGQLLNQPTQQEGAASNGPAHALQVVF